MPSVPGNGENARFRLPKSERISKKRIFELLFEEGKSFNEGFFRIIFLHPVPSYLITAPVQVAFAVPRRNFKEAVDRNRVRRQLKETYRLQKNSLLAAVAGKNTSLAFLVVYSGRKMPQYDRLAESMKKVISRLEARL